MYEDEIWNVSSSKQYHIKRRTSIVFTAIVTAACLGITLLFAAAEGPILVYRYCEKDL
jgi:hypothetical protein